MVSVDYGECGLRFGLLRDEDASDKRGYQGKGGVVFSGSVRNKSVSIIDSRRAGDCNRVPGMGGSGCLLPFPLPFCMPLRCAEGGRRASPPCTDANTKHTHAVHGAAGHAEAALAYGQDPRKYNVMTRRFVGDAQGKLTGVEIVGVQMERDAQSGQMRPVEVRVAVGWCVCVCGSVEVWKV